MPQVLSDETGEALFGQPRQQKGESLSYMVSGVGWLAMLIGLSLIIALFYPYGDFSFRPMPFLYREFGPVVYGLDYGLLLGLTVASVLYGWGLFSQKRGGYYLGVVTCCFILLEEGFVGTLSRTFTPFDWVYFPAPSAFTWIALFGLLLPPLRQHLGITTTLPLAGRILLTMVLLITQIPLLTVGLLGVSFWAPNLLNLTLYYISNMVLVSIWWTPTTQLIKRFNTQLEMRGNS